MWGIWGRLSREKWEKDKGINNAVEPHGVEVGSNRIN
jgi:hypothetical protein